MYDVGCKPQVKLIRTSWCDMYGTEITINSCNMFWMTCITLTEVMGK